MLAVSIALENVTGGLGSAAFVAYLSRLCNLRFTATQLRAAVVAGGRGTHDACGFWWIPCRQARLGRLLHRGDVRGLPGLLVLLWLMRRERAAVR